MQDKEILELAAKAAGMHANQWAEADELIAGKSGWVQFIGLGAASVWNPLTDDGDALRLVVKLNLWVHVEKYGASARKAGGTWTGCESHLHGGIEQATRRAIVRAAAEIGKGM